MPLFSPKWGFFLLSAAFLSCSYQTAAHEELSLDFDSDGERSEFSEFVENLVTSTTLPAAQTVGFGLTVVRSNSSTPFYWHGFGYRDRDNKLPVDQHTLFPLASITKSFVSVLCVKMLSEKFPQYGENVLELPVRKLLGPNSKLNWTLPDRYRSETISFRDLLAHRACTTNEPTGAQYGLVNSPEEFIYRVRYETEVCPFRTSWVYNNAMYALAGQLIADIAGQPFDLLMENLLTELGMTSSRLSKIDGDYTNMPNLTQAYYMDENQNIVKGNANLFRQASVMNPAGGLISTLSDMSRYVSFHMNGGSLDGKEILPKDKYQWLTRISAPIRPGTNYGLGLDLVYIPGEQEPLLSHNGYWPPYTGELSVFPSLGVSIFSASSGPGSSTPVDAAKALHSEIFAYFLAKKNGKKDSMTAQGMKAAYEKMSADFSEASLKTFYPQNKDKMRNLPKKIDRVDPSQAVGKFGAPVPGEFEISYKNEREKTLQLTFGTWGQADLVQQQDPTLYHMNWTSDIVLIQRAYIDVAEFTNILEFITPDLIHLHFTTWNYLTFERNLTLADLPEIPWDENSCGLKL